MSTHKVCFFYGEIWKIISSNTHLVCFTQISPQLFEKLKSEQPEYKRKCVAISGDIVQEDLGIDQSDEDILIRDVSVVFHSAATIKFDEDMKWVL